MKKVISLKNLFAPLFALIILGLMLGAPNAFGKETPDLGESSISIPWKDFKELLDKIEKTTPVVEPPPPFQYALGRGEITGSLEKGILELKATYSLSILKKGWVRVPLVSSSSPISDILIDGKAAPVTDNNGQVTLILRGQGSHTLTMKFRVTASMRPGPGAVSLNLPKGAGQVLNLKVGPKLSGVSVSGATVSHIKGAPLAAILTGDSLNISYTVASEKTGVTQEILPAKVLVENNTLVSIDEGFIRAVVQMFYEVRHAPVNEFKVEVPKGFDVADCTGPSLVGWKLDKESGVLTATVGFEVKGAYTLAIILEKSTKQESFAFAIPEVKALDVERERGFIAVQVTGGVEVTATGQIDGLQMVDSKELPPGLRSGATNPIVLSFKYLQHPFSADLKVVRHKTQNVLGAAIDTANYVVQVTLDGDCVSLAEFTVRNNRKQFLKIILPENEKIALWSSFVAGKPVRPSKAKDGAILLPLEKSGYSGATLKSFKVEIIYYSNLGANLWGTGGFDVLLPKVDLPISRSALTVFAPSNYLYSRSGGSMNEPYKERSLLSTTLRGSREIDGDGFLDMKEEPRAPKPTSKMKAGKSALMVQQAEAEQVFQRRIRAANEAKDSTGALPARFSLPKQGTSLRFTELITIDDPSTLRLKYISKKMITFLNYILFFLVLGFTWFSKSILKKFPGRIGYILFGAFALIIIIVVGMGCTVISPVAGAVVGIFALLVKWFVKLIAKQAKKPGTMENSP